LKPTATERFAMKAVVAAAAALILAITAQALPLSYLIEEQRAKIEPAPNCTSRNAAAMPTAERAKSSVTRW
jgi:hypothetical protein